MIQCFKTGELFEDPAFMSTSAKSLHEFPHYSGKPVWMAVKSKSGRLIRPYATGQVLKNEWEVSIFM